MITKEELEIGTELVNNANGREGKIADWGVNKNVFFLEGWVLCYN